MRIDNGVLRQFTEAPSNVAAKQRGHAEPSVSFAAALAEESQKRVNAVSENQEVDFTNTTRQELRDWVNDQIRSGQMPLDDSSSFMAMTMKISVETGQPVDVLADSTRLDFMKRAQLGIEGALSRGDAPAAARLQTAIETMARHQTRGLSL